jgi:hypothetical protein
MCLNPSRLPRHANAVPPCHRISFLAVSRIANPTYRPEPAEGSAASSRTTTLITNFLGNNRGFIEALSCQKCLVRSFTRLARNDISQGSVDNPVIPRNRGLPGAMSYQKSRVGFLANLARKDAISEKHLPDLNNFLYKRLFMSVT